ncbi:MAG: class I SAM-dependent methyltransferase [Candidatus Cloacimonetes bacterium]|jgi:SAM-dependent methyltransferase|nr:class I SAM-dependent methyltransferase [Candidatus Cloacimonadota bacterium]MDY0368139.1 class I SAM-dependent methyltransferase [Candidatus Syntrophosphaera sp.]NLF34000.1 class I SAM-dependent methyltransferase [Thermoplasmatales archaeon]
MYTAEEWDRERSRHPMRVHGMRPEDETLMWESVSSGYSPERYGGIVRAFAEDLSSDGILEGSTDLLDVGCGPGTCILPFRGRVGSITCLDPSPGMLSRAAGLCEENGIRDVSLICCDWGSFPEDRGYDVVFSSLCPAMNSPDSLEKMERCSRGFCVYVSSAGRGCSMESEIWRELGYDCSYEGYNPRYPYGFLLSKGRRPRLRFYRETRLVSDRVEDRIQRETANVARYLSVGERELDSIRSVVRSHASDGVLEELQEIRMGMITWECPEDL